MAAAGDSGGGTLAALACLRLRDEDPAALPYLQVLLYANTDLTGAQPSMRQKAAGWGLDAEAIQFFNSQWVPDRTRWSDPGVSPLHDPDLSGLPEALIVTAEHDPLRDESEAYAHRLREAGVDVELRREPGLIHNFMMLDEVSPPAPRQPTGSQPTWAPASTRAEITPTGSGNYPVSWGHPGFAPLTTEQPFRCAFQRPTSVGES